MTHPASASSSPPPGPRAEVIPLGRVHPVACAVAAAHLRILMGLPARVAEPGPEPDFAYLKVRGQYDAKALMDFLAKGRPREVIRVGVTEVDLCLPVFTFVFGEAQVGGGVAVASLCRLRQAEGGPPADRSLAYQRLAKVACHEAGHALGLTHCREEGCLMRFAGDLARLDALEMWLCPACDREVGRRRAELTS